MPLTPEDVHKKTFTPVRLREGYDMAEVDLFLDEVEVELTRLHAEDDDLRAKLATASTSGPPPQTAPSPLAVSTPESGKGPEPSAPEATQLPPVKTVREASSAAARLLEIAAQNADQLVGEAQGDADRILGESRIKAERLEVDAKAKSERLEADAKTRAEKLDAETSERREEMFGELERGRDSLAHELDELRSFEREYRSRLRGYFQSQLKALDGEGDGDAPPTPSVDGETPRRLRDLLGEDQPQER
ncbi:MAG: DivIVA domain-containing protein [Actinomycetota bacterium]|nr:DivIVA domain-containing protein [Actinomycetota bacterium]MDQ3307357.1 DivIVA domain-containing protein [Actinomycetota bacterium]MDQ3627579.1 DivIVA domain-containing protein [Actinomycetota bacterium]